MNRVLAAGILSVLIILIGILGSQITKDSIDYIQVSMQKIDRLLEENNTDAALKTCSDLIKKWDRHHGRLCMFLQHEHLDPIESVFSVLPFYIEQKEIELARAECRTVYSLTEHIKRTEEITIENIL